MKKLTALLLACMTFVCAAVSCGEKDNDKDKSDNKTETTTVADENKADEEKSDDEKKDSKKDADEDKNDDKNDSFASDDGESAAAPAEAEAVAKKFAEATLNSEINTMLSCLYPKAVVDKMNESGEADDFSEAVGEPGENGKLLSLSTSDSKKLSKEAAEGVKKYYSIYSQMLGADSEYKVIEGYSMKLAMKIEDDGETEDMDENIIVVKLEGEDWLLVPMGEDELLELVSDEEEEEEEESATAETTTEKSAE